MAEQCCQAAVELGQTEELVHDLLASIKKNDKVFELSQFREVPSSPAIPFAIPSVANSAGA